MKYTEAGVDIKKGDQFVEKIKSFIKPTYNKKVISGVGGFSALYEISPTKWLATGTDGVGTKVKLAQELNIHHTIGQDLVAMCVNDIICSGASPSFFLDYLATGKLDLDNHSQIVQGIANACIESECALIGGETAEMPGVYAEGVYDLAGFAVGELNPSEWISGKNIKHGDTLIGIASSGFHSNGMSLVRSVLSNEKHLEKDLKEAVLTPTRLYWKLVKELKINQFENILGIAHITGGGFFNIPRMNEELGYEITQIPNNNFRPAFMNTILERLDFHQKDKTVEAYRTFNMGIGMVFACRDADRLKKQLDHLGEKYILLGHVTNENRGELSFK
jgi:phosphoribosylformylglycinamidine cyclo-ligase